MGRFYITTAIDYANGDPHLGHAFEKIGADAIARYHRLLGEDVHFLVGMDEHGQKVVQTAAERRVSPQELVDAVADAVLDELRGLGVDIAEDASATPAEAAAVTTWWSWKRSFKEVRTPISSSICWRHTRRRSVEA